MLVKVCGGDLVPEGTFIYLFIDIHFFFLEAWGMFVKVCGGDLVLEGTLRLMPLQVWGGGGGGGGGCVHVCAPAAASYT
jgi:hypothetical protein